MREHKVLDEETVIAELRFAMEHKIDFCAHNIDELLSPIEIQNICNKLKIQSKIQAYFITDSFPNRAYYTLSFYTENDYTTNSIGTYFGNSLVSSDNNMKFEPAEESEGGWEEDQG